MKTCRLKIISSNIINGLDEPKIHYVSQNKVVLLKSNNENKKQIDFLQDKIILSKEDEKINISNGEILKDNNNIINNIQFEEPTKYDLANKNELINNNTNLIIENKNKEEYKVENNIGLNEAEIKEDFIEENNIDVNDLCTVSNQYIYEEFKSNDNNDINNGNNDNFNNNSNYNEMNNSSNYPYKIEYKKKEINRNLRNLFKTRENKPNMNRSLSFMNKNKKSLIKNIITKNANIKNVNSNKKNNSNNKKNTLNKAGSILNININKSFCLNNNKNKNIKLNSRNKNVNIHKKNKSNNSKNSASSKKNKNNIIMKKIKPLKIKKFSLEEDSQKSFVSWNYIEKNDLFIEQNIDYNNLINDLLETECKLVREKQNIINEYEQKLKPLRELNNKLLEENNEELDRQDELKGELTVLKNQYEKLFAIFNSNKINDYIFDYYEDLNINKDNIFQEEFNNKIKGIDSEYQKLNENLKKGELLLVIKPIHLKNLTENEIDDITLMLKGIFMSRHIYDSDKVVDLIWRFDKKLQTLYFLVEELIHYFKLELNEIRDILIKYFYTFCKKYNYMNINMFKNEFNKKIGEIPMYNKYICLTQLLNYHRTKINKLIPKLKDKDVFNLGIIKYNVFTKCLDDVGITLSNIQNYGNFLEFLIFCMKKDISLSLNDNNKEISELKYSLFDLYYGNLEEFVNEYDYNVIKSPFKLIRIFMKKNDINNAEYILKPILTNKYILKLNDKEYIDIIILNKYLRRIGIINRDEKICVDMFEEELVHINKFIDDIYNYDFNEMEVNNPEILKKEVDKFIEDIFGNIK